MAQAPAWYSPQKSSTSAARGPVQQQSRCSPGVGSSQLHTGGSIPGQGAVHRESLSLLLDGVRVPGAALAGSTVRTGSRAAPPLQLLHWRLQCSSGQRILSRGWHPLALCPRAAIAWMCSPANASGCGWGLGSCIGQIQNWCMFPTPAPLSHYKCGEGVQKMTLVRSVIWREFQPFLDKWWVLWFYKSGFFHL